MIKAAEMAIKLRQLDGLGPSRVPQSGFALPSEQTLREFDAHR